MKVKRTATDEMPGECLKAITGRRSVRRFLPDPVPNECTLSILKAASRAASGVNAQPWLIHIVTGAARDRLSTAVLRAAEAGETSLEYAYLPDEMPEPYLTRRRAIGHALYERYGIDRSDYPSRKKAMLRNFEFFGAPTGLFFTMDRRMTSGSWLDMGMFMQNVMILARLHGLETCAQQAWCDFGGVVHQELGIPGEHILLCGMAMGFADPSAPENHLVADRVDAANFTTVHDH